MMKRNRALTVVFAALLPVVLLSAANGCGKKDDDDKPAPSASAPVTAAPSASTVVTPEEDAGADAASDAADASDAKPKGGGGVAPGSLAKCCAALRQNANNAPIDQKANYLAAAAACDGMRNTPSGQQAFAQIRAFLAGAKMPGACQ